MGWYTGKVREPRLDGENVIVLGQEFVIPPFNIKRMRATANARAVLRDVEQGKFTMDSDEAIAAVTEVAATALAANYPDITAAVLDDLEGLRLKDLTAVMQALGRANNPNGSQAGEATAPETAGANESDQTIGIS